MKVEKMVPRVYYKESRDFSYIGRIFEIGLNYMKTCADLSGADPDSDQVNPMIVDLLSTTLGFESKHQYITQDLIAIASTLVDILKYKGTKRSIEKVIETLAASQQIDQELELVPDEEDKYNWTLIIPPDLKDIVLLKDLFDYILPAGICISLKKAKAEHLPTDTLNTRDNVPTIISASNAELSKIVNSETRFIKNHEVYAGGKEQSQINTIGGDPSLTYFGTVFTPEEEGVDNLTEIYHSDMDES